MLDAVLETIAEGGYDAVSMEDIAAKAGVHKTTVYRRWPTKADLVFDALSDRSQREVAIPDTGSLAGDLVELGRTIAGKLDTVTGRRFAKSLAAATACSPELTARGESFWAARTRHIQVIADRAVQRGEITADFDTGLVIAPLVGMLWLRVLFTGEPLDDATVTQAAQLIAAGGKNFTNAQQAPTGDTVTSATASVQPDAGNTGCG